MQKQGPNVWLVGLIILAAIYLTIFALIGIALLFTASVINLLFVIVGLSVLVVIYTIYLAFREKRTMNLSLSLAFAGVVFIILGAIVFVPYTTSKAFETFEPFDWTFQMPDFAGSDGTLNEQTLTGLNTRNYIYEAYAMAYNASIQQFEVSTDGSLNLEVFSSSYNIVLTLNKTFYQHNSDSAGTYWQTISWTPPVGHALGFTLTFSNLENRTTSFYFRWVQFYSPETINASNTNYRSIMDPSLAYTGLSMVCVAVAIGAYSNRNLRTNKKNHVSTDSLKD